MQEDRVIGKVMVVALPRRAFTRLGLNLFENVHDYHGIGFEVEKRLYLPHLQLALTANNTFEQELLFPTRTQVLL